MANRLSLSFDILARDRASRELEKPGDAAQRTADKVEHGSGRAGKAFGLLGKTFASSSAGALGPLQELTDKFEVFQAATEQGGSKASGRILGIGLAATAAGSFLESLHSREQAAQQQLATAIEATGHSYADYSEEIEKAVKQGEKFGDQSSATMDALNRLTVTTHSPEEAMKGLSAAFDVAAEKHVSLAKASEIVGLVFNGSTRAGKQFGLQLENTAGAAKALTTAQTAHSNAMKALTGAQTSFTEKQAIWNGSSKHTVAQAYALRDAHNRVLEAQDKVSASAARLKAAQEKAAAAAGAGERNVAKLTALHGQASAQAATWTGRLKALGAQIEDTLGAHGGVGSSLVTVGALTSGIGALASAGLFGSLGRLIGRIGTTGGAFKTLRDVEVTSSAEGAAAVEANAAAGSAAMIAEGDVAVAQSSRMIAAFGAVGPALAAVIGISLDQRVQADAKKRGGTAGKIEGILGSLDIEGAARAAKKLADFNLGLVTGDDGKSSSPVQTGDNNSGDDKLAMQRQKHADAVAKGLAKAKPATAKAGKDNGDAYLKGLLDQVSGQDAKQAANDAAQKAAQQLVDAAQTAFSNAQSRLQSIVSQYTSLRQSVTSALQGGSALTDIFTGQDLNANGAFGQQRNFGRVRDFLQRRVAQERKFVLELRSLMKQGLDPSLVAQIASAGVDGGQRVAEAILSGGEGGVGQVNSLERQIASLANSTGKSVADQHYAEQIKVARNQTEVLGHKLDVATSRLAAIEKNTSGSGGSTASSQRNTAALAGV